MVNAGSCGYSPIHPAIVGDLTWVKAKFNSVRGPISAEWHRDAKTVSLDVSLPANTTATVFVPAKSADDVLESGFFVADAPGVNFLRMENGSAIFAVVSGKYFFSVTR